MSDYKKIEAIITFAHDTNNYMDAIGAEDELAEIRAEMSQLEEDRKFDRKLLNMERGRVQDLGSAVTFIRDENTQLQLINRILIDKIHDIETVPFATSTTLVVTDE